MYLCVPTTAKYSLRCLALETVDDFPLILLQSLLTSKLAIDAANLPVQGTVSMEKSVTILNENAPIQVVGTH